MGNCKDCKHWHVALGHSNWNTCEYPKTVEYDQKIGDAEFAFYADAHDDSGLDYGLKTGPLFGCIKFDARKTTPDNPLDNTP